MRKLAAGLLAFVLVFAAAACGDDSGSSSSGTGGGSSGNFGDCDITVAKGSLGDVKLTTDGELTVATNLPAPGFWNGNDPEQHQRRASSTAWRPTSPRASASTR